MICIDDMIPLIEEIEALNPTDYGSIDDFEAHEAAREMKKDIIWIIEKSCGV